MSPLNCRTETCQARQDSGQGEARGEPQELAVERESDSGSGPGGGRVLAYALDREFGQAR